MNKKITIIMIRKMLLPSLLALATGCAQSPYIVELRNGTMVEATSAPKFNADTGLYTYQTADGQSMAMNKDYVMRIVPKGKEKDASIATTNVTE